MRISVQYRLMHEDYGYIWNDLDIFSKLLYMRDVFSSIQQHRINIISVTRSCRRSGVLLIFTHSILYILYVKQWINIAYLICTQNLFIDKCLHVDVCIVQLAHIDDPIKTKCLRLYRSGIARGSKAFFSKLLSWHQAWIRTLWWKYLQVNEGKPNIYSLNTSSNCCNAPFFRSFFYTHRSKVCGFNDIFWYVRK